MNTLNARMIVLGAVAYGLAARVWSPPGGLFGFSALEVVGWNLLFATELGRSRRIICCGRIDLHLVHATFSVPMPGWTLLAV